MNSVQDLIRFILRHDHVIVFGNLGRQPNILFDHLVTDPHLNVVFHSYQYPVHSTPDGRIRHNPDSSNITCDLMVVVEPAPDQLLKKPSNVGKMVVFTSHLNYLAPRETVWTHVCYFHTPSIAQQANATQTLLKSQDTSVQVRTMTHVIANIFQPVVIKGRSDLVLRRPNTYVLVDLTRVENILEMYLAFWDAFDFMLMHKDMIGKWMICFPEQRGRQAFEQFVQYCLDGLFCKTFTDGNVTDKSVMLSLLPFYKSGSMDLNFTIPTSKILGVEYISPMTPEDVCKAATKFNLEYWVGNLYRIKK